MTLELELRRLSFGLTQTVTESLETYRYGLGGSEVLAGQAPKLTSGLDRNLGPGLSFRLPPGRRPRLDPRSLPQNYKIF